MSGGSGPPGPASPSAVSAPLPWRPKFCRVRDYPLYDRSFDRNPRVGQSTCSSAGQSRLRAPPWLSKNCRRGEHAAPPSADAFSSPRLDACRGHQCVAGPDRSRPPPRVVATYSCCDGAYTGSNFDMSQDPLTFDRDTRTLLDVSAGSGLSVLVVLWLMNSSTTALSGCNSDNAD